MFYFERGIIMKKLSMFLAIVILFTTILSTNVAALNVGDKLGDVLNTDIKTYINGERIPCYNINGKAVVIVGDLRSYGFDVLYNNTARSSTVTRNSNKSFTPIQNISNNTAKVGTVAFSYLHTDIIAIVNGKKVESFNVQGNLAIFFSALGDYGTFEWNNSTRSSKLTLNIDSVQNQTVIPSTPVDNSIIMYSDFPNVPDFGANFNVKILYVYDEGYLYEALDITKANTTISGYVELLKKCGFVYISSSGIQDVIISGVTGKQVMDYYLCGNTGVGLGILKTGEAYFVVVGVVPM